MKKDTKKSKLTKPQFWGILLLTTLMISGTASQASAIEFNPLQIVGNLRKSADALINKFKNDREHPIHESRFSKLIKYRRIKFAVHFFACKASRKLLFSY
jgi:hypothetical protein